VRVISGIADSGKVVERTKDTILAREDRESFTLGPEAEAELLEAIEEADRGELTLGEELLRELGGGIR
jgi:hypothetical protein